MTNSVGLQSVFNKSSLMKGGKVGRREKGPTLCLCSSGPSRLTSQKSEDWLCPREPCHQILPLSGLRQLRADEHSDPAQPHHPLEPSHRPQHRKAAPHHKGPLAHWITMWSPPQQADETAGSPGPLELRSHREGGRYLESRVGDRGSVLGGQTGRLGFRDLKEG